MRDRVAFATLCTLALGTLGITAAVKYLMHTDQVCHGLNPARA